MDLFILLLGIFITALGLSTFKNPDAGWLPNIKNSDYEPDDVDLSINRLRGIVTFMLGVIVIIFSIHGLIL